MNEIPEINHPLDSLGEEERQRFSITDDSQAAWAMRKLRLVKHRQYVNAQIYKDEVDRMNAWLDDVNKPLDREGDYFEAILRDYAIRCRDDNSDGRKSLNLPTGKVSTRVSGPKWDVDPAVFLPWAREAGRSDLIRVKEEPNITVMKETLIQSTPDSGGVAVTADGEVVPGIGISPETISVTVTPMLD